MPQRTLSSNSERETRKLAGLLGQSLRSGQVVALSGPLGSGKTLFAKALAKRLGVRRELRSPSFVICSRYQLRRGRIRELYHCDLYRLRRLGELEQALLQETFGRPGVVTIIEWAERLKRLPPQTWRVSFSIVGPTGRRIRIRGTSSRRFL